MSWFYANYSGRDRQQRHGLIKQRWPGITTNGQTNTLHGHTGDGVRGLIDGDLDVLPTGSQRMSGDAVAAS
jgi:hypothetical protein